MLSVDSRYKVSSETRNGSNTVIAKRTASTVGNYTTHTCRYGDSFESLAARYLGTPTYYWKIADLNPHVPFPNKIDAGTIVRIPR